MTDSQQPAPDDSSMQLQPATDAGSQTTSTPTPSQAPTDGGQSSDPSDGTGADDPAEPSDPPESGDPTQPPSDPDDPSQPPADSGDPSQPPADPSQPPASDQPAPPAAPAQPQPPADEGISAPEGPSPEVEQYAADLAAAQADVAQAEAAYQKASSAYSAVKDQYAGAKEQVARLTSLAADAERQATLSKRALGALVQALSRHSDGSATVGTLLGDRAVDNLLFKLGALDQLSHLTGDVREVRKRVDADAERAKALAAQEKDAKAVLAGIPVAAAQDRMTTAEAELEAAKQRLSDLQASGIQPAALSVTALPIDLPPGAWTVPVVGTITDPFGLRSVLPNAQASRFHRGTDIAAACGTPIRAAAAGVVEEAEPLGTYGNWILIDDGSGIETGYAHIATGTTLVSPGQSVSAGQIIAAVGATGDATGCHLHFEVRVAGTQIDPQPFMSDRGVPLGR